jgi:heme exporter protein C
MQQACVAGRTQDRYIERMIRELANPTRFMSLSGRVLPWVGGLAALLLGVGLYLVWFVAPADYQQGDTNHTR